VIAKNILIKSLMIILIIGRPSLNKLRPFSRQLRRKPRPSSTKKLPKFPIAQFLTPRILSHSTSLLRRSSRKFHR
jgi:hypothetical protein